MKTFQTRTAERCTVYLSDNTFHRFLSCSISLLSRMLDTWIRIRYVYIPERQSKRFLSCSTSILSHMLAISPPAIMLCRLDPVADYSSSNHCTHHLFSLSPIKMISYIQHIKQNSTNIFLHFWQQWNQRSLDLSAFSPNRPLNAQKRQHLRVVCPKPGTFCQT